MGPGQGHPGRGSDEGYDLGIDLGTTWTAAAVRPLDRPGVRVVDLEGPGARQVPSVLLLDDDGSLLVGSAAEARAPGAPQRVVREFKRRLGDETPIIVAGTPISADGVAAEMVRWTADTVAEQHGRAPRAVTVAHPAGWGAYRRRVFTEALAEVGLHDVHLLAEPEAAAVAHAAAGGVPVGHTVAVYDLGGGTFDAAVVQGVPREASPAGLALLGRGQGLEALGGIDFDEALFWHVCAQLGGAVAALDPADPVGVRAVAGLRRACVAAKEALSVRPEVVVPVDLPGVRTQVRVTRGEFEEMIAPAVGRTVDVLWEVLDAAGLAPGALDGVLLVGGSSRIPCVARAVAGALGRPVAVDPDPTTVVARGAALAAAGGLTLEHRPGGAPAPRVGSRPIAPMAPIRTPGRLVGPPESSGPLPVGVHGADRTGALLAGTTGPRPVAPGAAGVPTGSGGVAVAAAPRPITLVPVARGVVGTDPTDHVGLPAHAFAGIPAPRPGTHPAGTEDDAEAVTAATALPGTAPVARRSAPAPAQIGPATPTGLGLRPLPQRPPVRDEALPIAPDVPSPARRRRRIAVAVGVGAALVVGGVVAVTVPMISGDTSPRSLQTALPAPAPAAPAPSAAALPPDTLAPAAGDTAASTTGAATTDARRRTTAARPVPRAAAPRAAVPAAVAPAPAAPAPAPAGGGGAGTPAPGGGGAVEQPAPGPGPGTPDPGTGTTPDTPGTPTGDAAGAS